MKKGWSDKAANGKPLKPGQLAYYIDLEDGTRPMFVYGWSETEVLEKLALTAGTAQAQLMQERTTAPTRTQTQPPPPSRRPTLTAEQQMIAVSNLSDPGKAPAALVSLVESETGVDFRELQLKRFSEIAVEWRKRHPDFYYHPANMRLLTELAITRAGGLKHVTEQTLDAAYNELQAGGFFVREDEGASLPPDEPPDGPNPAERPNGHSAPTTARTPSPGVSSATTYRSSSLYAPPSTANVSPRLKYTRDEIERMPSTEMRRLIELNDPHFNKAFEYYNSHPREADIA
jgi:hypothetical protein